MLSLYVFAKERMRLAYLTKVLSALSELLSLKP